MRDRSAQINRRLIRGTLQEHRIGLVLFMSGDDPSREDTTVENHTCAQLGIRRLNYNLNGNGTGKVSIYIDALSNLIRSDRDGVPVLVHCETGAQRTGGMVAFYRVLVEGRVNDGTDHDEWFAHVGRPFGLHLNR